MMAHDERDATDEWSSLERPPEVPTVQRHHASKLDKLKQAAQKIIRTKHEEQRDDAWDFESDVAAPERVRLMLLAQGTSKYFRGFMQNEIGVLANLFSFFTLRNGDDVICAGERASFFALIVNGRVDLMLPPASDGSERSVPMYKGDTLGDVSYFSGGARSGSCRCRQNGTVIAVLPFMKIRLYIQEEPVVICKLVWMIAQAAFAKLLDDRRRTEAGEKFRVTHCPSSVVAKLLHEHCYGTECLADVDLEELAMLAEYFELVHFKADEKILVSRKNATCALLHVQGLIVIAVDNHGTKIRLHPRDLKCSWCGELALLTAGQRQFDVIAGEPVTMLMLSIEKLQSMRLHHPVVAVKLYQNMVRSAARVLEYSSKPMLRKKPTPGQGPLELQAELETLQLQIGDSVIEGHEDKLLKDIKLPSASHDSHEQWQTLKNPLEKLLVARRGTVSSKYAHENPDAEPTPPFSGLPTTANAQELALLRAQLEALKARVVSERLSHEHEMKKLRQEKHELASFVNSDGMSARSVHRKLRVLQSELSQAQSALKVEHRLRTVLERNVEQLKLEMSAVEQKLKLVQLQAAAVKCTVCSSKLTPDVLETENTKAAKARTETYQATKEQVQQCPRARWAASGFCI